MKKGYKKILIFEIILFLILLLNSFVWNILNRYKIVLLLLFLILIFKVFFGNERERKRYIKDIIFEIIIIYLMSFMLFYIFGIFIGFYRNDNYFTWYGIKEIILPIVLFIVFKEYFRHLVLTKSEGNNLLYITTCILFILFDLTTVISYSNFSGLKDIFTFISLFLMPAISNNIVSNYIANKSNYKINILWLFIAQIYMYLLPIIPNTGDYILSIIKILFPFVILSRVKMFFNKENDDYVVREYNKKQITPMILASIIVVVIVYFTSGHFKYYAIAIATGSMETEINVGDVVVVEKVNNYDVLDINDVIVYNYGNVMVVHRVINIINDRGKRYFYTKGDANNSLDNYVVEEDMIVGIVNFKIPYLGFPTIWLNSL